MSDDKRIDQSRRPWDTIADGIPQTEEQAKFAGIPWDLCQKLNARQKAVADCRRRAANNSELLEQAPRLMTPSVLFAAFARRFLERFGALFFSSNLQTREAWPQAKVDKDVEDWMGLNP